MPTSQPNSHFWISGLLKLKKFKNNIFTRKAITALGFKNYLIYIFIIFFNLLNITRSGDLRPVDKKMSKYLKEFKFKGDTIFFDCKYVDSQIVENSFAFGVIREIIIRDCYFKFLPSHAYHKSKKVLDIGSNRGLFSTIMSKNANLIISVESLSKYTEIVKNNLKQNKFTNHFHENCFVGGDIADNSFKEFEDRDSKSIDYFFEKYRIDSIDIVKLDIEGSEFKLFTGNVKWLDKVKFIVMEVHPSEGDPGLILKKLEAFNFKYKCATEDLVLTHIPRNANFIYAWK